MSDVLHIDFETYSECDLADAGAHLYAEHPSTLVHCAAWALNDDPPVIWIAGQPCPDAIVDHVLAGGMIEAWNAQFERLMWRSVLGPKHGWPVPHLRQYRCVMVQAAAMAFPLGLGHAAPALGLDVRKDDTGRRVMLQLCKPRSIIGDVVTRYTPESHPFKFQQLYDYCITDVLVEQACSKRLAKLSPTEQNRYWRDQAINDRGVFIDMPLVEAAQKVIDTQLAKLNAEMKEVTGGAVSSTTVVAQLKAWLIDGGIPVVSLDKENLDRLLARDDLSNSQRVAIEIRKEAGKTSTAKLTAFRKKVDANGRVRGTIQFNGAWTGRDAARGVQVQNFPRPDKKTKIEAAIATIMTGKADRVQLEHGKPMSIVADCLRSCICAGPGNELIAGDLSSIEARLTSYLSGQEHMVEAFRRYDAKTGPDIYIVAAAGIYDVAPEKIGPDDPERQVGKVSVLALGFGGGAGAFASMAKVYRVDVSTMFDTVWGISTPDNREKAVEAWKSRGSSSGIRKKGWIASELVKLAWRADNPDTVDYWRDLENAAIAAIATPGETFDVRGTKFRKTGSFLRCILRSGRSIFYPYPKLVTEKLPWTDAEGNARTKMGMRFMGVDRFTRQWSEQKAYGGFLCQNIVQSTARDIMWEAVERIENAGYPNVMRVHDEPVCEREEFMSDKSEYLRLLTQPPTWAPDLPVAAGGWIGQRYRK